MVNSDMDKLQINASREKLEKQLKKLEKHLRLRLNRTYQRNMKDLIDIWKKTLPKVQEEYFYDVINLVKGYTNVVTTIWQHTLKEVQEKKIVEVINLVKENPNLAGSIWSFTPKEVQEEKFDEVINLVKEDFDVAEYIWLHTKKEVQEEKFDEVINLVKEDLGELGKIWMYTKKEVQEEKFDEVINLVMENLNLVSRIWYYTSAEIRIKKFDYICEVFKNNATNVEQYKDFVAEYIPNIKFDETLSPIIPQDLKEILYKAEEKEAKEIEKNFSGIITNWDIIKRHIHYKKSNSILNNDIEIRVNAKQIIESYNAITKAKPLTLSAIEFDNIPGTNRILTDTKFIKSSPNVAWQRAYSLAEKMDKAGNKKKYPNFSVKDEENGVILEVLHPQDKTAIMLGHDTNCCFRPHGNADGDADGNAKNEFSLLQYCTTTPYGGVLECKDVNNSKIYMGTPFLVNGNCMIFHSYETSNEEKKEIVNDLLVKSAKKAIEMSNGEMNAVMMTTLYPRLNIIDKFAINSFFEFYSDEEYAPYKNMYTNLNAQNVLLAAKVGRRVLIGKELKKWCIEKCQGDIQKVERKLGLKFGKIEKDYEFPKRKNLVFKRKVEKPLIVKGFKQEYDKLKESRAIIALINRKKVLQSKKLDEKEEKELKSINEQISLLNQDIVSKYDRLSLKQIKKELEENWVKMFELYKGNDLTLLAKQYGILPEQLEEIIRKKAEERAKEETNNMGEEPNIETNNAKEASSVETKKQKKVKSQLIGEIKRKKNVKLNNIIFKIQNNSLEESDYEILQKEGISIDEYKKVFAKTIIQSNDSNEKKIQMINQKIKKYIKDADFRSLVVMQEIIPEIKQDLIIKIAIEKTIGKIRTELENHIVEQEFNNPIVKLKDILMSISVGKQLNEEEKTILNKLNENYNINVEDIFNQIMSNKEKLENEARKKEFAKIKASITIGIEKKEEIKRFMQKVGKNSAKPILYDEYDYLIFANDWYIATGVNGSIDIYIDEKADEKDKNQMQEELLKMIKNCNNEEMSKKLLRYYNELFEKAEYISLDTMEKITQNISGHEKSYVSQQIQKIIKRVKMIGQILK